MNSLEQNTLICDYFVNQTHKLQNTWVIKIFYVSTLKVYLFWFLNKCNHENSSGGVGWFGLNDVMTVGRLIEWRQLDIVVKTRHKSTTELLHTVLEMVYFCGIQMDLGHII